MIYDISKPHEFVGRKIFFDTNVYIFVDGYDSRSRGAPYSRYYWSVVKKKQNEIIINDYILSEFFNRCCKDQHILACAEEAETGNKQLNYKDRRNTEDFIMFMESIRDACLDFIKDSTFVPTCGAGINIERVLRSSATGRLDFSDIMILEGCVAEKYVLVTDDADFISSGVDIVTANRKLLDHARDSGLLAR